MKRKNLLAVVLVIALVLSFINPVVYARQEEITVHFNGAITMILDGEEFIPLETDGSYLIPVIYNGRTYLPVRALCDALKLFVDWDASTKTVSIGGGEWVPPQKVTPKGSKDRSLRTGKAYKDTDLKMVLYGNPFNPREADGTLVYPILVNNRTYLPLRALCDAVGVDVQWDGNTSTITMTSTGKGPKKDGEYIHDGSTYEENISYFQDLEPIYNVSEDQVFKFKLKLSDAPFASFGINNMFKVFSDRDCTTELIARVDYDEESNIITIKPDDSSWGMYPRKGVDVKGLSWGGLQKYYIVIYHDLNATEVTKLSKPMRLMFTVGSDIPIPTVKVKKDNNGNIILTWNKIEGAQKYKIYRGSRYEMELLKETTENSMSMTAEEYADVVMNSYLSDVYSYAVTSVVGGKESRLSNIIEGEDYISIAPSKLTASSYYYVGEDFDYENIFSLPKSVSVDYLEYIPSDVPGRFGSYKTSNHKVVWDFSKDSDEYFPTYEGKVLGTNFKLKATFYDGPPTSDEIAMFLDDSKSSENTIIGGAEDLKDIIDIKSVPDADEISSGIQSNDNVVEVAETTTENRKPFEQVLVEGLMERKKSIYVGNYAEAEDSTYLEDVILKVIVQNPLILDESRFGYDYRTKSVLVEYKSTAEVVEKKQKEIKEKVKSVVEQVIKPGMSLYEKELALHDWLVDNGEYHHEILDAYFEGKSLNEIAEIYPDSFNAYGILINGLGVCQSYAEAFKLLCDEAGVPCVVATGDLQTVPHAWNMVKIGEKWAHVDVTNNDIGIDYPVFNATDNSIALEYALNSEFEIDSHLVNYVADSYEYDYYYVNDLYASSPEELKEKLIESFSDPDEQYSIKILNWAPTQDEIMDCFSEVYMEYNKPASLSMFASVLYGKKEE